MHSYVFSLKNNYFNSANKGIKKGNAHKNRTMGKEIIEEKSTGKSWKSTK